MIRASDIPFIIITRRRTASSTRGASGTKARDPDDLGLPVVVSRRGGLLLLDHLGLVLITDIGFRAAL
jgi:hypothetical protein